MLRTFDPLLMSELTSEQWGLITTRQAERIGVSVQQLARLAKTGTLERVRHGVYRVAANPPDHRDQIRAAWLALEPQIPAAERVVESQPVVLSHRSAAAAHALGDLEADTIEFTVPTRRQTRSPGVRFHVRLLDRNDWMLVDGLPVTTILTTIGDLAAAQLDSGHLAGVVRDALATHHLAFDDVVAVLRPYAHLYAAPFGDGSQLVERLLDEAGVPASSVRLGQHALNSSRQRGTTLVDTSTLNASMEQALKPLLQSPAVRKALLQIRESLNAAALSAIDTSRPQLPVDDLNASLTTALQPLLQNPAIQESTRRIRETLDAAVADAFRDAMLTAISDQVTAQQSPSLGLEHPRAAIDVEVPAAAGRVEPEPTPKAADRHRRRSAPTTRTGAS